MKRKWCLVYELGEVCWELFHLILVRMNWVVIQFLWVNYIDFIRWKGMWLLLLPVWFFASKKRKEQEEQRGSPMANSQSSFLDEIRRILFTSSQKSLTPLCTDPTMITIHDYLSIHPSQKRVHIRSMKKFLEKPNYPNLNHLKFYCTF